MSCNILLQRNSEVISYNFCSTASDESQDVFCCGTDSHKYCCTKKDQVVQAEVEE